MGTCLEGRSEGGRFSFIGPARVRAQCRYRGNVTSPNDVASPPTPPSHWPLVSDPMLVTFPMSRQMSHRKTFDLRTYVGFPAPTHDVSEIRSCERNRMLLPLTRIDGAVSEAGDIRGHEAHPPPSEVGSYGRPHRARPS